MVRTHRFNACHGPRSTHTHPKANTPQSKQSTKQSKYTKAIKQPKVFPQTTLSMQRCHTHVSTRVRTTYTCHDSTGSDFVGCPCVRTLCWLSNWPSASTMDLAGHHYGMPRDIRMIGDMCFKMIRNVSNPVSYQNFPQTCTHIIRPKKLEQLEHNFIPAHFKIRPLD